MDCFHLEGALRTACISHAVNGCVWDADINDCFAGLLGKNWNGWCRATSSYECAHGFRQIVLHSIIWIVCPQAIDLSCIWLYRVFHIGGAFLMLHVLILSLVMYCVQLTHWCRCIPLNNFSFTYGYLFNAHMSFVDG